MPNKAVHQTPSTAALVVSWLALFLSPSSVFASAKGPTAVFNEAVNVVNGVRTVQLPPFAHDDRIVTLPDSTATFTASHSNL